MSLEGRIQAMVDSAEEALDAWFRRDTDNLQHYLEEVRDKAEWLLDEVWRLEDEDIPSR